MPNISINGKGQIDNGKYDYVVINGAASSEEGFEAIETRINGTLKCNGPVKCEYLKCNGTARLFSDIDINELHCDGSIISAGTNPIKIKQIYCDGAAKFSSDVITKTIDIDGSLNLMYNCNLTADKVFCDGSIIVNGNITTNLINSDGFIYARTISAKNVFIRTKITAIARKLIMRKTDTVISEITGEEVDLVGVKASKVSGKNIVIGDKCIIDHIECNGTLHISENARVSEITGNYTMK